MPRITAAIIALIAWVGLAVQFNATFAVNSLPETLWILSRFFTVIANLVVAITFSALALGRRVSPSVLGGVTILIALVGVVYMLLLRGLLELSGGALLADTLLHKVVPLLAPLWWLAFAPKGGLRPPDPWLWSLFPVAYFVYAIARGLSGDIYPYPFMNVGKIGWAQTLINSGVIALCFVLVGYAMLWLDRRLAARARP